MLTIKVVDGLYASEQIWEAVKVDFLAGKAPTSTDEPLSVEQVMFMKEDKSWDSITRGMIYVMNSEGRTIAKYDLLPPPPTETRNMNFPS
jgi:hypothetical protein